MSKVMQKLNNITLT